MVAGALLWLGGMVFGFAALQRYAADAGPAQAPSTHADDFIARHRRAGRGIIVMAVHPQCPCTRASLGELGDLLARSRGACDALLLEYQPRHVPPDWPRSGPPVRELGGVAVRVRADRDGAIARMLGAKTSGHVVFADRQGTIRFHGGITLARGHRGRSPAQDAILATLAGNVSTLDLAPVYGCTLAAPGKTETL